MKKFITAVILLLSILVSVNAQTYKAANAIQPATANNMDSAGTRNSYMSTSQLMNVSSKIIPVKDAAYYLEKSKNQKTSAWVMAGIGVAAICGAILNNGKSDNSNSNTGNSNTVYLDIGPSDKEIWTGILGIIGGGLVLGSIPCFIMSGVYKHKAKISINNQKAALGIPALSGKLITGINLSIPLGK